MRDRGFNTPRIGFNTSAWSLEIQGLLKVGDETLNPKSQTLIPTSENLMEALPLESRLPKAAATLEKSVKSNEPPGHRSFKGLQGWEKVGGVIPKYESLYKGSLILPTFVPPFEAS